MAKQDRFGEAQFRDQAVQIDITFGVVEVNRAWNVTCRMRIGFAMAAPFIDNYRVTGGGCQFGGEVTPHANGAKGLVQKQNSRCIGTHIIWNDLLARQTDTIHRGIEIFDLHVTYSSCGAIFDGAIYR